MKNFLIILALLCGFTLSACSSGASSEQYESVIAENESLSQAYSELSEEYNNYKASMSEYEGLAQAEAEARRIQAESIEVSHAESIEASEAESRAIREAEDRLGYDTGITYEQIARWPDDYFGDKVKFSGTVLNVLETEVADRTSLENPYYDEAEIILAVDGDENDMIYGFYLPDYVNPDSRILINDQITIYGVASGLYNYEFPSGRVSSIPYVDIRMIDL